MKFGILIFLIVFKVLTANKCNFDVKVSQTLYKEGFHRKLMYKLVFNSEYVDQFYENCTLCLDQTLPAGVFVNPDELADLGRSRTILAIPKNRINVELPAEQSEPIGVFIFNKVFRNVTRTWLPVHARYYQAVSGGGAAKNVIKPPKLYIQCPDKRLDVCGKVLSSDIAMLCSGNSKEKCSWKEIPLTTLTDTLIWQVPVGNTDHYYVVAITTSLVIIAGSICLLKSIHDYKMDAKRKRL